MQSHTLEATLIHWGGELLVTHYDAPSGAWFVIAIHSTRLGPSGGGTRMQAYPSLVAAIDDACKLARSMTDKFAVANFPLGGGKAVIALPENWDQSGRTELLQRFGACVHQLRGLYVTGPDVGTGPKDMDIIATTGAPYVFARTTEGGGAGSSASPTALGVLCGIEAVVAHVFGDPTLRGRKVLVQGVGSVGQELIARLRVAGAEVLFSDIDPRVVQDLRDAGLTFVPPDDVLDTPCDVLAPCALGGVFNTTNIDRLRCRIIAGAANNQLATSESAAYLHQRGIVYVPDFVLNSGGAMYIVGVEALGWSPEQATAHVQRIGGTVRQVLELAETQGITSIAAAQQLVEQRLAQARPESARSVVTKDGQ
ncbi:MAG: Glu/Leu/Phe/Val dehydrogenase [Chloroflexi bacterium AL-W]|nr:Glu/Leu/Phe/Val dehydrogenase [Chloroflexi bacterium AL-N1]NOK69440.1 Glu/Leu/Phe/Val dehydrogenase [Chloroflexi bacterium AL-N10]NOK77405.1 Glu/Leu/Phe/Val dehydrogenase [Chloroflexi bacterium AL-N5]NOK84256.1 Glu/Leu/Phe/Val dehydrogenase [Chloroflexi bacterium AL-W]NOK91579.1 Glu/Leu/Phe/Val dehydrogenase [Chloroflexi bacterium AL-N15]